MFENFWTLIIALAVFQIVLIAVWSSRRTNRSRQVMLIGFALCVALPIISRLIVTDREQVAGICKTLVDLTELGDVKGIAKYVAEDFDADGIDRDAFNEAVESTLTSVQVQDASIYNLNVTATGDEAEAQFGVSCKLVTASQVDYGVLSAWTVRFIKDGDDWKVVEVQPRETQAFPFNRLRQIIR